MQERRAADQTKHNQAECGDAGTGRRPYLDETEDVHEGVPLHDDDLPPQTRLEGLRA